MNKLKEPSKAELKAALETEKIKSGGLMGNLFGKGDDGKTHATLMIICLLIAFGFVLALTNNSYMSDFWKTVVYPAITAWLGYIFGKRNGSKG